MFGAPAALLALTFRPTSHQAPSHGLPGRLRILPARPARCTVATDACRALIRAQGLWSSRARSETDDAAEPRLQTPLAVYYKWDRAACRRLVPLASVARMAGLQRSGDGIPA